MLVGINNFDGRLLTMYVI